MMGYADAGPTLDAAGAPAPAPAPVPITTGGLFSAMNASFTKPADTPASSSSAPKVQGGFSFGSGAPAAAAPAPAAAPPKQKFTMEAFGAIVQEEAGKPRHPECFGQQ
eukprot:Hpha_TRINITY_DN15413_c0_g2::TRINITY_DN15413_c0_g2_i3::g.177117::m.177117